MAKAKPRKPPSATQARKGATPDGDAAFDRTVSALFQVPKSAIDNAKPTPKRARKKKG